MNFKLLILLISVSLTSSFAFSQEEINSTLKENEKKDDITFFKPTVGLGVGILSFQGDVGSGSFKSHLTPRIGYNLQTSARISNYFDLSFEFLTGKLEANERSVTRNLNFQSEIRSGGMRVYYNFGHLLKEKRHIEPFISLGIESLEFLSKADLEDSFGNRYNYWSDGSIRNLPENSPNAASAIYLQRDYFYETDLREYNIDALGRYAERTLSIPAGIGFRMFLTEYLDFRMGTTLNFTFSNFIDGSTENSIGPIKGNNLNDKFIFTSISVGYRFSVAPKSVKKSKYDQSKYKNEDFITLITTDADGDGVTDFHDLCPETPKGVKVDGKGCPVDTDKDGVPDYLDKDNNTPKGAIVDKNGVELSEQDLLKQYQAYTDTTGKFSKIVHTKYEAHYKKPNLYYMVQLGVFDKGIPANMINKFLSIPDVSSMPVNETTTAYNVGLYTDYKEAINRKNEIIKNGIEGATLVMVKNGKIIQEGTEGFATPYVSVVQNNKTNVETTNKPKPFFPTKINAKTEKGTEYKHYTAETLLKNDPSEKVVFRVQLGAFSKKPNIDSFSDLDDIIAVTTDDGLTRIITGSYSNFNEAAKQKTNLIVKGYPEAFIVAYKNGQRVSLSSVGATPLPSTSINSTAANNKVIDKSEVKFKVQVGAFKEEIPQEIRAVYNTIAKLEKQRTASGLTRYLAGSFNSYSDALAYKNKLVTQNLLKDAFVVAFYKGQMIPVQEAMELLK
jgi:cell division protein FtsN